MPLPRLRSLHAFMSLACWLALLCAAPAPAADNRQLARSSLEPGIWDQYPWHVLAAVLLILLLALLGSALLYALHGHRRALSALKHDHGKLTDSVAQRTLELQAANNALEQQVTTDSLTGIGNRRRMTALISAELERTRRFGHPLSLLMIDIDHIKDVNDHYGHDAGDRAIVAVAMALSVDLRACDSAARFGGEEFVVLMPETELRVAADAAERLRNSIAALRLEADDGRPIGLTISIGVAGAVTSGEPDTPSTLLSRADRALHRAKTEGRNRVERAEADQ